VRVSVLSTAFRPGGIDVLLAGMSAQTFDDFEVILVDRRYERRRESVAALAAEFGVDLLHVPEHRRNGRWWQCGAAWNTAIALSAGDLLIFIQDYTCPPPGWIQAHVDAHEGSERRYVLAPSDMYGIGDSLVSTVPIDRQAQETRCSGCVILDPVLTGGILDEISVFGETFDASWFDGREPRKRHPGIGMAAGVLQDTSWTVLKNESVRRSVAFEVDGMDERLDRGRGPTDIDWAARLRAAGVKWAWAPDALTPAVDGHDFCGTMPWGAIGDRVSGRWSYRDGLDYVDRRAGSVRAANPWAMQGLAKQLEPWRDGRDIDVGALEVSDDDYWEGPMWPDTP